MATLNGGFRAIVLTTPSTTVGDEGFQDATEKEAADEEHQRKEYRPVAVPRCVDGHQDTAKPEHDAHENSQYPQHVQQSVDTTGEDFKLRHRDS